MKENEIFISGYAKLPNQITASKLYEVIAIGLIVNKETSEILDAECSLATKLAVDFVRNILVGEYLNDTEKINDKIQKFYYGSAKKALITAINSCKRRFLEIEY